MSNESPKTGNMTEEEKRKIDAASKNLLLGKRDAAAKELQSMSKQSSPIEPERKFFIDEISPMIKAVINKEMSVSKFVERLNEIANRDIDEWMKENPPFSGGK